MSGASLEECALRLGLPDVVKRKSRKVLQEWAKIKEFQNDALWIACAIYTAVIECRSEVESPSEEFPVITLQQILKAAQVNMKSFLDCMDFIEKRYEYSKALKDRFIGTKKKYGITLDMYLTFQRLMDEIFQAIEKRQMPLSVKDAVVKAFSCLQQYRRRVCWCLFLVAKETICKNAEEMNPVQLLLCCIHYIMKQVPLFMLKERFRTAKSADVANGFAHSSMLSEINVACHSGRINDINMGNLLDKLLAVQANMFEPFLKKIPQEKLNQGADGLPELGYLEGKYKAIYEKVADIDEMTFLENDPVLMPVGDPHPGATSPDTTRGDVCQPVPHTPARTLNTILANATDKPSSSLLPFLKEYGVEASVINKRVECLKEVFVTAYSPACGKNQKTIAETRYRLGVRLYYREMENFLKMEKPRQVYSSSSKKFLSGDVFHKCLLACCLEIVKVTKESCASPGQASPINNGRLSFPWILSIFELHAYDFCKVIETFIREEPLLCKEAVEYLIKAEEFILKSEAWKEGSPLFIALKEKGILRDSNNGHFPSSRVVASSGNPEVSNDFLNEFQMKMQQLGYIRLKEMSAALKISGELENSVWTCLDHCIMERPGLLKNRHLDQIMMCCIFEIFKANKEDIANIIAVYSKMPQAVSSTYNHVKLNDGTYGKISDFYKLVFIDALKDFIIRFQPHRQSPHISPGQSTSLSLTPNQRMAYHLTPTLRISPFTASCSKSACQPSPSGTQKQMTPGQKSLLHFVIGEEQNSPKLQEFNQTLHLQAKRKTQTQRQGSFKRKKKLKLEDSKCEVGSNTESSKQPAREESITPEDVTSEGDIILSGRAILRDRLSNQRAGSPTEEWISDNEEPQEDNSDGDKEEKPTSKGDETSQHSSEGHKEDTDAMT